MNSLGLFFYFCSMPNVSKKGLRMPASPIRKLVPFAEAAKAKGKHIYHLNIGQPDIETPPQVMDAIRSIDWAVVAYSHSAGYESYRRKLTGYYKNLGIPLTHEEMIVTAGASEALLFAVMSCLDAGDEIIIPEPFYANYNGFSQAAGVSVVPITSYIEQAFALPPIADFEKCITPKTKAILICNPSNPTGYVYSREELMTLKEIALKHDLFLFVDEVYREFCYDDKIHHSVLSLEGLEQHAIVFDSISKRYSACGARIGTLISRNKEVINTAMKFAQARLSPPSFGQVGAEAALDVGIDYFNAVKKEYLGRRNILVEKLNQIEGVICPKPTGAFYAFAQLPIDDSEKFCQWLLEDFEYEGASVMLAPGSGFYSSEGLGKNQVRIAYVLNQDDLVKAVKCLEEALKVYGGLGV